jgi:precorrin-2 methylase
MTTDNGGPAFPAVGKTIVNGVTVGHIQQGMTLRDFFAAAAIEGVMSVSEDSARVSLKLVASEAYLLADEMLKARAE